MLCYAGFSVLPTKIRGLFDEEILLLSVLKFPFRVLTPRSHPLVKTRPRGARGLASSPELHLASAGVGGAFRAVQAVARLPGPEGPGYDL
jgi:hypothetical protein